MAKMKGGHIPSARYVGPSDELRFGEPDYAGGRVYPVCAKAHAKLRAFWQREKEPERAPAETPESPERGEVPRRGRRIELSPEQLEEAIRRHGNGESLAKVAASFGVSTITLILRLREIGYDTSRRPRRGREVVKL